jgi:hypothetical protein
MSTATQPLTKKALAERDRDECREVLRKLLPPGSTVYTVLKHVSSSGMLRHISLCIAVLDERTGKPVIEDISWRVAQLLNYRRADNGGLKVSGAGMDMGYHLVNTLSYALHGYESQGKGREAEERREFFGSRNTDPENYRAGYSLEHQWL